MKRLALLVLCSAVACAAGAAEMYRWVDKDGKVHYTDSPPPATARKVEEKNLGGNNAVSAGDLPYATRMAAKNFPVTLYVSNCGEPCTQARQHLAKRGIPYTAKNPASSQADTDALKKLVGSPQVPVLVVGGTSPLKGYDAASWDAALDAAGYPKSKPYGYKEPKLPEEPKPDGAAKPEGGK
jgi:glutaredoxin